MEDRLILSFLLALGAAPGLAAGPARERRPPNLVLLVADDLGRADLSAYDGTWIQTPHIDALGAAGVICEDATVTAPICAPSRAALLTGRYQQRFGFELINLPRHPRNELERRLARPFVEGDGWELAEGWAPTSKELQAREGLPPGEITLAELLRTQGYSTAMFGKWHLGSAPDQVPDARGFDTWYGFYEAHTLYADPRRPDIVNLRLDLFADRHQWRMGRQRTAAIRRDGQPIDEPRYLTDALVEESTRWIAEHREDPFFLYVPFLTPHTPYQVPRDTYDSVDERDPGRHMYAAMLRSLDEAVGSVLQTLDEQGLAEDTLVVLLSDNGGASYTHVADNSPWRGGKFTFLEGGVRVPMMLRWPGQIPAGRRYQPTVSALDVFATFAEAAGAPLPADRPYDGVSLLPFLRDERQDAPHEALFWRAQSAAAVRAGPYKLLVDEITGDQALYDLSQDPYETADLADQQPQRVEQLRARLEAWSSQMVAPGWPPVMQYRYTDGENTWVFPL